MTYQAPHVRDVYGPPDFVVLFVPATADREDRARKDGPRKIWLDSVAPSPARSDKSPGAKQARKLRSDLRKQERERDPHVGGRLILKKRNQKRKTNRKTGRKFVGSTNLWDAFQRWFLVQLSKDRPHARRGFPLEGPVHLVWRYYAPDRSSWPDHPGLYQTVADLAQAARLVRDDVQIEHEDLSRRCPPDPETPRLELWIRPAEPERDFP